MAETMDPSMFDNCSTKVRQAVWDSEAYAAIIINAKATTLLHRAVVSGNTSCDPYEADRSSMCLPKTKPLYHLTSCLSLILSK